MTNLCLLWAVLAFAAPPAEAPRPAAPVSVRRPDTRVQVVSSNGVMTLDVECPFGIDRAVIRRPPAGWPREFVVRLRLKGLEGFKASAGRVTAEASAGPDGTARAALRRGGEEMPLDPASPYWTPVRFVRPPGTPAGGFFEVRPPAKLFESNPDEVTLEWVDFYRG